MVKKSIKTTSFLIIICFLNLAVKAQNNYSLNHNQTIIVHADENNQIYTHYVVNTQVSLFKFAQSLGASVENVFNFNNIKTDQNFILGEKIEVPIALKNVNTKNVSQDDYIPLVYRVKKGDTFYHLTKNVLKIDSKSFQALNNRTTTELGLDEEVIFGYIKNKFDKTDNVNSAQLTQNIQQVENISKEPVLEDVKPVTTWFQNDVIAYWDKKNTESSSLFVLHNEAKLNSIVDIYFPMRRKTIKAKVLGRIPLGTYSSDIDMILSTGVARELGILDSRCRVNIKYEALNIVVVQE